MKKCNKCGHFRDGSEFARNVTNKDGLQRECRTCRKVMSANRKRAKERNPTRQAELRRLWRYDLKACDYTRMRIEQGDRCAICRAPGSFHIDHDHATGKVRGLLCGHCNRGLGQFADSVESLTAAIQYLSAA